MKILAKKVKHWESRFTKKKDDDFWSADSIGDELAALLAVLGEKRGAALDVGCGAGGFTRYLASQGFAPTVGLDLARSGLQLGIAGGDDGAARPDFLVGAAPYFPFAGDRFDLIFDRGCIHLIDESMWPDYLAEVTRLLAPDGLLHLIEQTGHWERLQKLPMPSLTLEDAFAVDLRIGEEGSLQSIQMTHALLKKAGAD